MAATIVRVRRRRPKPAPADHNPDPRPSRASMYGSRLGTSHQFTADTLPVRV